MYLSTLICPPPNNYFGVYDVISIDHVLCFERDSSFAIFFASGIFRIDKVYSVALLSVMLYVHEHDVDCISQKTTSVYGL